MTKGIKMNKINIKPDCELAQFVFDNDLEQEANLLRAVANGPSSDSFENKLQEYLQVLKTMLDESLITKSEARDYEALVKGCLESLWQAIRE